MGCKDRPGLEVHIMHKDMLLQPWDAVPAGGGQVFLNAVFFKKTTSDAKSAGGTSSNGASGQTRPRARGAKHAARGACGRHCGSSPRLCLHHVLECPNARW